MRKLIVGAVVLLSMKAWAVPAAPLDIILTQPDGDRFVARPQGDEYADWMETVEGYTIVKSGATWYYATLDATNTLAPTSLVAGTASKAALVQLTPHIRPKVDPRRYEKHVPRQLRLESAGAKSLNVTQPVLTIMVSFTDIGFNYTEASFQSLMYGVSDSVKAFYSETSYNGFTVVPATETYGTANDGLIAVSLGYAHPNFGNTFGAARNQLVADTLTAADPYINYASYDTSANGSVSVQELSIIIIVAGYENAYAGASSPTPRIWAHKSSITNLPLDAVNLAPFCMFGERHAATVPTAHQATIGVMCHELGHLMFGLPDLYDRDTSSAAIGEWCLMASGSWNNTGAYIGDRPSLFSAWCKTKTGIVDPQDITTVSPGVQVLRGSDNASVKRVWIDKYKNGEHFLVENRQLTGYDAALPGSGLMIWHIDSRVATQNDVESHKLVDLEEADGLASMDTTASYGDTGDPYPGSTNNLTFNDGSNPNSRDYFNAATNIGVTGISTALAPTLTADITPKTASFGDWLGYDEYGYTGSRLGYTNQVVWTALAITNTSGMDRIDGFDIYCNKACTVDFYLYTSIPGGNLSGLLHTQTGFAGSAGYNRFLLTTPQAFPNASTRVMVLRINMPTETFPANYDGLGVFSGNSYLDNNGSGTFFLMSSYGDLNQRVLLNSSSYIPTANSITPVTASPTSSDTVTFSVSFSEDVQNFNALADLVVSTTGSVTYSGASIADGPQTYSVSITGVAGDGTLSLAVNTGSDVQDTEANALGSSVTSSAVTIDNTGPTIALSSSNQNPANGAITVNVALNESSTDFVSGDVTPTNASVSGFSGSGASYSFTLTPSAQGAFSAVVNASTCTDALGNTNSASNTLGYTYDSVVPTIALSSSASDPTKTAITVTATLSESSANFTSGDVTPTNAAVSGFSGSGMNYSFTLTPSAQGSFSAVVNASAFTDGAGNNNTGSNTLSYTYDSVAPTVLLSSGDPNPTSGAITVDAELSESSATFASGDITPTNAAVSGFSGSGTSYSFTLTPSGQGAFSAVVNASTFTDAAGNNNTVSNTLGYTHDSVAPSATLSSSATDPANAAITVDVVLDETSTTFASGDVTPTNAAVSGFSGSGTNYSFTLTPSAQGSFSAVVNASTFTDAAGNDNTVSNTLSYTYDSVAPTIALSSSAPDPASGVITVDAELSESSTTFTSGDVTPTNAAVSGFSGSGTSYSFTLTPSALGTFSAQVDAGAFTDAANNGNAASNVLSRSYAPTEIWVDAAYSGTELGTLAQPFNTVAEGIAAVAVSGMVRVKGSTSETPRIVKAVRLESYTAPARIGGSEGLVARNDVDSDGDGLPDWWELQHGLDAKDPTGVNGASGDPDGDGFTNADEWAGGSDPQQNEADSVPAMTALSLAALALFIATIAAAYLRRTAVRRSLDG